MRRATVLAALLAVALGTILGGARGGEAGRMRMVVADLPYARVWGAALQAAADFPLERVGAGRIVTGWRERAPREGEPGFVRIAERVTLEVQEAGERITLVTVEVEARGWRDGEWVTLTDTETTARAILARLRDAQG